MAYSRHNEKMLWQYINEDISHKIAQGNDYFFSQENFFKDFNRFDQELFIKGNSIEEILSEMRNQIKVARLSFQAIQAVAELIHNPEQIEAAYLKMTSILKDAPESFKALLEKVVSIIKTDMPEIAAELQTLAPILNNAAGYTHAFTSYSDDTSMFEVDTRLLEVKKNFIKLASLLCPTSIQDETTMEQPTIQQKPINDRREMELFKAIEMLKKLRTMPTHQPSKFEVIETIIQNNAANEAFEKLFEKETLVNKQEEQLEIETIYKQEQIKKRIKGFLKLFLHQGFIFPNINVLSLFSEQYTFLNPIKQINLVNNDDGFFIQVSFEVDRIYDHVNKELLEPANEGFYVKGMATYKINIIPYNINGWVAQVDLIESTLESCDSFKAIFDTATIFEKLYEFLESILTMLKAYLNLEDSLLRKPKFKPFFFASSDGESVLSEPIYADNPNLGNVLNILLDRMRH